MKGQKNRKLSVLILDDEEIVRRDLRTLIDWEDHGYEIVEEAGNAAEALKFLGENEVSIVIADIEMPGMNGIEFAQEAMKLNEKIKILFLTAYNDFNYVRSSVRLGIVSYILKHELDENMLVEELNRVRIKIENDADMSFSYYSDIMDSFLHIKKNRTEKYEFAKKHKIPFAEEKTCFIKIWLTEKENTRNTIKTMANVLYETCEKFPELKCLAFSREEDVLSALISFLSEEKEERRTRFLEEIKEKISEIEKESYLLVGEWIEDIGLVREYYQRMKSIYDLPYLYPEPTEVRMQNRDFERAKASHLVNDLLSDLSGRDYMEAEEKFDDLVKQLPCTCDKRYIQEQLGKITAVLLKNLLEDGSEAKAELLAYEEIREMNYVQVCDYVYRLLQLSVEQNLEQADDRVGMITVFISKHYDEDISLDVLAGLFHVSESYMSQIFKVYMGMSFKNYLRMVRMEKAGGMLLEGKHKIHTIARKTGYSSTAYFCTVFKQYFHMTPSEYVEKQMRKDETK